MIYSYLDREEKGHREKMGNGKMGPWVSQLLNSALSV